MRERRRVGDHRDADAGGLNGADGGFAALTGALHGVKTERSALDAALSRFELAPVFGGITKDEVLGLMLGEGD